MSKTSQRNASIYTYKIEKWKNDLVTIKEILDSNKKQLILNLNRNDRKDVKAIKDFVMAKNQLTRILKEIKKEIKESKKRVRT